jgi:protease-4
MKQFLKFTLATIVGIILTSVLGMFIMFGILGALTASQDKTVVLKPKSVYVLELNGQLVERSEDDPYSAAIADAFGQDMPSLIGLDDVLSNIKKAKNDSSIVGIYLKGGTLSAGKASMKEIRSALEDFKKSGKFIVAYADTYEQSNYYLATVANKVFLNPSGMLELRGLSAEILFLKNTFDKLGIDMQVVKVGTFKSAVEPYINTKMSDANKLQVNAFLTSMWKTMTGSIASSRKLSEDQVNRMADEMMLLQPAKKLVEYALIDSLVYIDEMDSIITKMAGGKYETVKHNSMCHVDDTEDYSKDKVAVIYAYGGIDDGESDGIVSKKLVETIDKAAKDDMVKSVVLRVSSPGGSAYGSEQIWRALTNLKKKKPLIVSMGDYAASGGYYISCMADTIVAQPNTLTGSIGIFGIIPNLEGLNKKLGFTFDGVKTNKMSDAISMNRPFNPEEREMMQLYINSGYELFVKRCADGRGMSTDGIKAIAEGRVWTGVDAKQIGLVDVLGGLSDAVAIAAKKAGLETYQIRELPEKEDFSTKLMKALNEDVETKFLKTRFGEHYQIIKHVKKFENLNGIQARMPYELLIR